MPSLKEKQALEGECFLSEIYKCSKMGADAVIKLLPHVKNDALRSLMTQQLDGYEKYAARAAGELEGRGVKPKEENLFTRFCARVGLALGAMMDATASHIAEMMIEGSNMAITDLVKLQNGFACEASSSEAMRLSREVVAFEEHNVELLKRFL
jgi:hypothetical protein